MTAELPRDLLQSLHAASACMTDIRTLAGELGDWPTAEIEEWLRGLVDAGEDRALSRLLQVCAFNEVKLDAEVLVSCVGVCEGLFDSAQCFAFQDEDVIDRLLEAAAAEDLSLQRQCFAARLAAELTAKFRREPKPARKIIWKLQHATGAPEVQALLSEALLLLDEQATFLLKEIPRWSELPLASLLPERKPRNIVGGDYTVRRPVPKLGRNDPCHCGSGKKYKKCCYAKDQELMRDASPYAGATMSDLKARPGLVDDPKVILDMRAHDLKRLTPDMLSDGQLYTAYHRTRTFGLRELAFDMLLECERRSSKMEFDRGHFEDLIEEVLHAGDLDLAQRIRQHCGDQTWWRPDAVAFRFDLLENPQRFETLEVDCRKALCDNQSAEPDFDAPLIRLAYDFAPRHPALAIVFARAAIASSPERYFDNEMLLDTISDARVDLDLEPTGDPAEALFDWIEARGHYDAQTRAENKEIKRLRDKLDETLVALDDKKRTLRETETALGQVGAELEQAREVQAAEPERGTTAAEIDVAQQARLRGLREQVDGLKAEIGEQQAERRQLRKLLNNERKQLGSQPQREAPAEQPSDAEAGIGVEPAGRPVLPDYADSFRKRLASLPPALASKAILAIGRFAAHDPDIWRQTKPLERLSEHYRIRLGRDHRMLVHWQPGKELRILDVIPRQDLESWIKRQG